MKNGLSLLTIALDHLTLARSGWYKALLAPSALPDRQLEIQSHLDAAVDGLREAGHVQELPRGLLTRAWFRYHTGDPAGSREDLDEAEDIARRGPMPLYLADILLTRARLSLSPRPPISPFPHDPRDDLAEARRLIEKHGYHRRDEELADAEAALREWEAQLRLPALQTPPEESATMQKTIKTVVELDLIGYSDKARELEEHLGVELVMRFNDQIKDFIDTGLAAAGLNRDEVILKSTGDGAIIVLEQAEQAHRFAEAVSKACLQNNAGKTVESAKRWFRIAAATGDVEIRGNDLAGIVIANAVRLESAGEAGHFIVDRATWKALPLNLQQDYLPEEEIRGKRDELIPARRCVFDEAPRPDHVELKMNLKRADFNDLAIRAFIRDLTRTMEVDESSITVEGIRNGSVEIRLRFWDTSALAAFINRHVSGDPALQDVFDQWKVQGVTYHAKLAGGQGERAAPEDLLEVLASLPTALFAEVVYRFDRKKAVSGKQTPQRERAIELLELAESRENGISELRRLVKQARS